MNVVRLNFNKSGEVYDNDIDPIYEQFLLFPQCFQKPCTADT